MLFSVLAALVYVLTSGAQGSLSSTSLLAFVMASDDSRSKQCEMMSRCGRRFPFSPVYLSTQEFIDTSVDSWILLLCVRLQSSAISFCCSDCSSLDGRGLFVPQTVEGI